MTPSINKGATGAKAAKRYFLHIDISTALFVATIATKMTLGSASAVTGLAAVGLLIAMGLAITGGPRDEFARHSWHRGTAAAFITMLVLFVALPFAAGFMDGFMEAMRDSPQANGAFVTEDDYADTALFLAMAAFFAAFQWSRFAGGRM